MPSPLMLTLVFGCHPGAEGLGHLPSLMSVEDNDKLLASNGDVDDWFGYAVAGGGDLDGDGYHDLLVSAVDSDGGASDGGSVYLYYGSPWGLLQGSEVELYPSDSYTSDHFGGAVSFAGDMDGDGYDDIVVGAPDNDDVATGAGAAYVYYGSSTGLDTSREDKLTASDGASGDGFGDAVAGAGDLDGDGYDDIVVGAPDHDTTVNGSGAAYVYYGSSTGVDTSREDPFVSSDADVGAEFGEAVDGLGDVDGDSYDDIVVGSVGWDNIRGAAYVYYGSSTGLDSSSEQSITASDGANRDSFGNSVAGAGDVNGDGYPDLVVGSSRDDDNGTDSGSAYVYYGSASGMTGETKLTASDGAASDDFGYAVSGGVDLDADGYDDIVVGAYQEDECGSFCGAAYVYYGAATSMASATEEKLIPYDELASSDYGYAVAAIGDVEADGAGDLAVGAWSQDSSIGAVYTYSGDCPDADSDGTCDTVDCDDSDATVDCVPELGSPAPGTAGGDNTFDVTDAEPNGTVVLVRARSTGSATARCGVPLDVAGPKPVGIQTADATGATTFTVTVPPFASKKTGYWQAISVDNCMASEAITVTWP